jgi:hypothetical protein
MLGRGPLDAPAAERILLQVQESAEEVYQVSEEYAESAGCPRGVRGVCWGPREECGGGSERGSIEAPVRLRRGCPAGVPRSGRESERGSRRGSGEWNSAGRPSGTSAERAVGGEWRVERAGSGERSVWVASARVEPAGSSARWGSGGVDRRRWRARGAGARPVGRGVGVAAWGPRPGRPHSRDWWCRGGRGRAMGRGDRRGGCF